MKRRAFIAALGGAAAWPLVAQAQQAGRIRHIGMLVGINDPDIKAFQQELENHGWFEGRNIRIDYRFAPATADLQTPAREMVSQQPEVILPYRDQSPPHCATRLRRYRSSSLMS